MELNNRVINQKNRISSVKEKNLLHIKVPQINKLYCITDSDKSDTTFCLIHVDKKASSIIYSKEDSYLRRLTPNFHCPKLFSD